MDGAANSAVLNTSGQSRVRLKCDFLPAVTFYALMLHF